MKKNVPVLDLENYKPQHNIAIDMCANCIIHERRYGKPVKALILSSAYFGILKKWVADNYGEETALKDFFLDTVEIRCERIYSGKTLLVEYFQVEIAKA